MALYKLEDFKPNYRDEIFDGEEVKGMDVFAGETDDKIGSVRHLLVDESGRFRYLVIDTGFWIFGKKVLIPIGRCRLDAPRHRVYALGLTSKEQAENLPEYDERMTIDYDYEERVRGVYRTPSVEASLPVEASAPVDVPGTASYRETTARSEEREYKYDREPAPIADRTVAGDRDRYTYDREPDLYQMSDRNHPKLRLYEERLVADKTRQQTGEVTVGKRVETTPAAVAVPVEKERVVVERTTPTGAGTPVTSDRADFQEGEVARIEVYEEKADIKKQAFVREEVQVKKEVERDTVKATDKVRREELDVKTEGEPIVERSDRPRDRRS